MQRKVGYEIREILQLINRNIENLKTKENLDLSFLQARTIGIIKRANKDFFQKDLEEALKIRRSTATQILNVLERDGYLVRESVQSDKRLKKLSLTAKSIAAYDLMLEHINEIDQKIVKNIDQNKLDIFFEVIDQIKVNLES